MTAPGPAIRPALIQTAVEAAVRIGLIALLVLLCFQIVRPFLFAVIWGVIIAVATHPGFVWLKRRLAGRGGLAATLMTVLWLALLIGPIGMLTTALVDNVTTLGQELSDGKIKVPPPPAMVATWPVVGAPLSQFWHLASVNLDAAFDEVAPQVRIVSSFLLAKAAGLAFGLLQLLIAVVVAGVLVVKAPAGRGVSEAVSARLLGDRGHEFVQLAADTIRSVSRGVLGIAVLQALLAGIGLVAAGVPAAGLIAFFVLVLSAIQIGPGILLVPAIVYVFMTADTLTAVLFAAWTLPVMLLDNFLKPILLARGVQVPMLVIFLGVIGGTLAYGIVGLFVGPVILAVGYKVFIAWVNLEHASARAANSLEEIDPS
jgi:predicted PurR-regulated permease PerM